MRVTQGTVSVANGATAVSGSGTQWLSAGIIPGMSIFAIVDVAEHQARVSRVADDITLYLADPWTGPTQIDAEYVVVVDFTLAHIPLIDETAVELPALLNTAMERIETAMAAQGIALGAALPRFDELTPNVAELWNSVLDILEARIGSLPPVGGGVGAGVVEYGGTIVEYGGVPVEY